MRLEQLALLLVSLVFAPCFARAQNTTYFLVAKGQILSQTSASAPIPASTNGFVFHAETPGLGGPPLATGAHIALPGGATNALSYSAADDLFEFTSSFSSAANLDAAYPAGVYALVLDAASIGFFITETNTLPADAFPTAPQISGFNAAQAVDSTHDFLLAFQPFDNPGASDDATIEIYQNGALFFSDTVDPTSTNYTVSAGTLSLSTNYQGRLRFRHITPGAPSGLGIPAFGFYSETWFPIVTTGGVISSTAPVLTASTPSNGALAAGSVGSLVLQFNEPMNPADIAIQWSATQNGVAVPLAATNFLYIWSDPATLVCTYNPQGGGWPAGSLMNWTLNPTPGAASNFADANGNLLPANTYSGSFYTPGGPWSCVAQIGDPIQAPAFYLTKTLNYTQTSDQAPVPAAQGKAQLAAYFGLPALAATASQVPLVLLATPPRVGENPTGSNLVSMLPTFRTTTSYAPQWVYNFWDSYLNAATLDAQYPAGTYYFEMAYVSNSGPQARFVITNSVSLPLVSGSYPPAPQFYNASPLPPSAMTNGFTVSWDPYANADPQLSFVTFQILDAATNIVFSAPDACAGINLAASGTSVSIPPNSWIPTNGPYALSLTFGVLTGPPASMAAFPGQGYSAMQSATTMPLLAYLTSQPLPPPPTVSILSPASGAYVTAGPVGFQVSAAGTNGTLAQLQLLAGTNILTTLPFTPSRAGFNGLITGTVPPGPQSITVVATDTSGQTTTAGPLLIVAQSPAFSVNLTSPTNGAEYPAFVHIPLAATASSPGGTITNVTFFVDGALVGAATNAPWKFSLREPRPGTHAIYALASDNAGFSGVSATSVVSISTIPTNQLTPFLSTNGLFSAGFAGSSSGVYFLQGATALGANNWTPVQTKLISGSQTVFSDPNPSQLPVRFYRAAQATSTVSNAPAFSVQDSPNPAVIGTDSYDWNGGALPAVTNSDGTVLQLNLPPGAMDVGQPVCLTVVTNLQDYPLSGKLLAAANISPSEFLLIIPGSLTIQLPPGTSPTQVVAFSYHQPNGELYLTPFQATNIVTATATNPAVVIPITRLGGYGLAARNLDDLALLARFTPSDPDDALTQGLSILLSQAGLAGAPSLRQSVGPTSQPGHRADRAAAASLPPASDAEIGQLLQRFDAFYPRMQTAAAGGYWSCIDWHSWINWILLVNFCNGNGQMSQQITQFRTALASIIQIEVNKKILSANETHDWSDIVWLANFDASGLVASSVVQPAWGTGQQQSLQNAIDNCLTFELDVDSSMTTGTTLGNEFSELKVAVTFQQGNPGKLGQLKGQAAPTWIATTYPPVPPSACGAPFAVPTTPPFFVYGFTATTSGGENGCFGDTSSYQVGGVQLCIYPNHPSEGFQLLCPETDVTLGDFWWDDFGVLHQKELKSFPTDPYLFDVPPAPAFYPNLKWQISTGGSAVLATCTSKPGAFEPEFIQESTTYTLKHTPQ